MQFLPTGSRSEPLADLVFFYIGEQLDWEVELALPTTAVEPPVSPEWEDSYRAWTERASLYNAGDGCSPLSQC